MRDVSVNERGMLRVKDQIYEVVRRDDEDLDPGMCLVGGGRGGLGSLGLCWVPP